MNIMKSLSTNKAITLDGLSDTLFSEQNMEVSSKIFRDLWSINLTQIKGIKQSFTSRLIPLNKVYPNTLEEANAPDISLQPTTKAIGS